MSAEAPAQRARLVLGTPQHYRWLGGIVKTVLVLNLLDAVFTLVWVGSGQAEEANPLLRELVVARPVLFVAAKLGLVGLASALLWRLRARPLAVVAIFAAFLLYYLLLLWHVGFLALLVGEWLVP